MKKIFLPVLICLFSLFLGGCKSVKDLYYFQNLDTVDLSQSKGLFDARIMPKDLLTITVITTEPAAAAPFNLAVGNMIGAGGQLSNGGGSLQGYLVDNDGNINFPIIGRIHVTGLTKGECENLIASKVQPYLAPTEKPIVTVRMSSFRVTILGEVGRPSVVPVGTEKMSILEAMASVGDLTVFAKRNNILLIRENEEGQRSVHRLNISDASILNSPYYYLQQNDVIYVEPKKVKVHTSYLQSTVGVWVPFVSLGISLMTFMLSILK